MAATSIFASPNARNRANLAFCANCGCRLDFPGLGSMFRATFGKFEPLNA